MSHEQVLNEQNSEQPLSEDGALSLFTVHSKARKPIKVTLQVNGHPLTMELDTGAAVSIVPSTIYNKLFPKLPLKPTTVRLSSYTRHPITVAGELKVTVSCDKQYKQLTLYVVEGGGPCLLGRDWLQQIRLDWKNICSVKAEGKSQMEQLLQKYAQVFSEDVRSAKKFKASLHQKPGSQSKFSKARPVPFTLKGTMERELDLLENLAILEKVTHSQWASPVVPVPKADGCLRLCGNYKATLNPTLEVDQYPLPRLQRLQEYNIQARRDKCVFMVDSVEYLGHRIDASRLHNLSNKVRAACSGSAVPKEPARAEVLPGPTALLWKVYS